MRKLYNIKTAVFFAVLFLFLSILSVDSYGQNIPPGSEPGAQASRFEKEVELKEKALERKPKKAPEIEMEKEKEEAPAAPEVSFVLEGVRITGATIFKDDDFKEIYQPYVGKKVGFVDLDTIIAKIKAKYKQKGYLTTTAYIPEQEIREGVVEVKVLEGKMGEFKVEGNKWFSATLIKKFFHTKKNEVLNFIKIQKDLLRINQNPDLDTKLVLEAGKEPETSDLTLKVKDSFPYHIGASIDNQGTRLVGKNRFMLTLRSTNATGNDDTFFSSMLLAKDSNAQSIGYSIPVDTYGAKLGFNFSHFNQILGKEYRDLGITGDSKVFTPYVVKELSLSDSFEAYLNVGIDIKSIKKHNGGIISADDQMRVPYLGLDIIKKDLWGQTTFSPRISFGTGDFLGASAYNHPTSSRDHTGGFFFKYEHTLWRIQRMFLESYSVIRSQFQASPQTLSPSEQLQIGGLYSVRGYPEGDFLADTGMIFNIDWIFPMYFIPENIKLPKSDVPLRRQIEPLIFMDMGGGRINKTQNWEVRDKFLMGIGAGIRIRLYKNIFCRFEWAKDVGAAPTPGTGHGNFHFYLQTEV